MGFFPYVVAATAVLCAAGKSSRIAKNPFNAVVDSKKGISFSVHTSGQVTELRRSESVVEGIEPFVGNAMAARERRQERVKLRHLEVSLVDINIE